MARKADIYIDDYKRGISNEYDFKGQDGKPCYAFWLTPEQARSACKIEREETIKEVCEWLEHNLPYSAKPPYQIIEDLRKAMEE